MVFEPASEAIYALIRCCWHQARSEQYSQESKSQGLLIARQRSSETRENQQEPFGG